MTAIYILLSIFIITTAEAAVVTKSVILQPNPTNTRIYGPDNFYLRDPTYQLAPTETKPDQTPILKRSVRIRVVKKDSLQSSWASVTPSFSDESGTFVSTRQGPVLGLSGTLDWDLALYSVTFLTAIPSDSMVVGTYSYEEVAPTTSTTTSTTETTPTTSTTSTTPTTSTTSTTPTTTTTSTTPTSTTTSTTPTSTTTTTTSTTPTTTTTSTTPTTTTTSTTPTTSTTISTTTSTAPTVLTITSATTDVSNLLQTIATQYGVPGMAAVVVHHGQIVATGAVGKRANTNSVTVWGGSGYVQKTVIDALVTRNDLFHLGSDTKSMTATIIARLVQEGRLSWDMRISNTFPTSAGFQGVTLRQLLSHKAGLPYDPSPSYWSIQDWTKTYTPQQLMALRDTMTRQELAKQPVVTPGYFNYSNVTYIIAAHLAEVVMNQPWETLMQNYLFGPLQMNSGGYGAPGQPCGTTSCTADQPWGHSSDGTPIEPGVLADNASMLGPSGTVRIKLADWATYANMYLQALNGNYSFLDQNSVSELDAYRITDGWYYGLGWWLTNGPYNSSIGRPVLNASERGVTHDGSNTYWYATTSITPSRDLAILVVTNQGGTVATSAAWAALKILYDQQW